MTQDGIMYVIKIIDRKTGKVVQEEIRKSERAADRLWCLSLKNVNQLKYKIKFIDTNEPNASMVLTPNAKLTSSPVDGLKRREEL